MKRKRMVKIRLSLALLLCAGAFLSFVLGIGLASGAFVKERVVTKTKEIKQIDANNVFLGDSLTDYFDLDAAFPDYSVVNSGVAGNTTDNVLADLNNRVTIYNPSQVFVWLGTNDLRDGKTPQQTIESLQEIIDQIQTERSLAKITLISLIPVNAQVNPATVGLRSNDHIQEVNQGLQEIAKEQELDYIDLFSELKDEQGNLKSEYTVDGLHLSDAGYQVVLGIIEPYLDA